VACLSPKNKIKQNKIKRHIEEVDERVGDTLQTTAGEETVADKEASYEKYNKSYSPEVERLLIYVAELEKQKAEMQSHPLKEPTAGPDAALLLPVVFAGIRMKKCVAAMFSPCRLSLSGWEKRGHSFINPKIDRPTDRSIDQSIDRSTINPKSNTIGQGS
jgi:hypothetical protein